MKNRISRVLETIKMLLDDDDVPKAVKNSLESISLMLKSDELAADKAIDKISEIIEATETPAFVRAELWNLSSMLES